MRFILQTSYRSLTFTEVCCHFLVSLPRFSDPAKSLPGEVG